MTTSILVRRPADPELCRISAVAGDRPVYEVDQLTASGCKSRRIDPDEIGAILGASPLEDFSPFGSLRWIHSSAAGVDAWLAEGGIPEGVTLTSATGNGAVPLAEHAIMLMLMLNRNACRWFAAQQRKEWDRFVHGELAGASLGIIGYGNSGRNLARKALPFHMRVRALRRTGQDEVDDGVDLLHGDDGLRELLANSDFVVVTAPLTPETRHLIGAEQLDWMRPNACIVVVSRGGIVETDALVRALHEGRLAGAGLDAHAIEPLPSDSSLWQMENVIVTPHNGATTAATVERGRQILLENVERWVNGRSLRNVVDPDRGY